MPLIIKMNSADYAAASAQQNTIGGAAAYQTAAKKHSIPTATVFNTCTLKVDVLKIPSVIGALMHPQVDTDDSWDVPQPVLSAARHKACCVEYRRVGRKTERV